MYYNYFLLVPCKEYILLKCSPNMTQWDKLYMEFFLYSCRWYVWRFDFNHKFSYSDSHTLKYFSICCRFISKVYLLSTYYQYQFNSTYSCGFILILSIVDVLNQIRETGWAADGIQIPITEISVTVSHFKGISQRDTMWYWAKFAPAPQRMVPKS